MNRIILIGNGFDLAHGMKTSYISFIKWYLKECFSNALKKRKHSDLLIDININSRYHKEIIDQNQLEFLIDEFYKNGIKDITELSPYHLDHEYRNKVYLFEIGIKSTFLKALLDQCSIKRWVDVEAVFYEELISILDVKKDNRWGDNAHIASKEAMLEKLNGNMQFIISQLEEYLRTLPKPAHVNGYEKILASSILVDDLDSQVSKLSRQGYSKDEAPQTTHILNFNYTDTAERYLNTLRTQKLNISINYIHGKLSDSDNPIVFGFGDELDERYLQMEREKASGYFKFIKSFWYFRTFHYKDLVRFTDSDEYQVFILGHSCGLSDRTMLHMILENPNCKSVKIYYHETESDNNYTDITYEIARHFKDKEAMRERIVSLDKSIPMPQTG